MPIVSNGDSSMPRCECVIVWSWNRLATCPGWIPPSPYSSWVWVQQSSDPERNSVGLRGGWLDVFIAGGWCWSVVRGSGTTDVGDSVVLSWRDSHLHTTGLCNGFVTTFEGRTEMVQNVTAHRNCSFHVLSKKKKVQSRYKVTVKGASDIFLRISTSKIYQDAKEICFCKESLFPMSVVCQGNDSVNHGKT